MSVLLRSAERAIAQKREEEAEHILISALAIHPQGPEVRKQLAKLYLTTGHESKAEAIYHELIADYDDVSIHENLALACYCQGKFEEARTSYRAALERDPKNPERLASLGCACFATQRFAEAADLLNKALTKATMQLSRDTELLHMLADCYVRLEERQKAEETYRRINKIKPYDEEVKAKLRELAQA